MSASLEKLNGPFRDGTLTLRPLMGPDAGELYMLVDAHRGALSRWLPWVPLTRAVADSSFYIQTQSGFWKAGLAYGLFVSGDLAGTMGFQHGDERHDKVEVGYWLAPPYQGQGVATRALRLLLKAAFQHTTVHRVAAKVQPANQPSIALLERLEFRFEGVEREGMRFPDGRRDHEVYSLLRHEFPLA